MIESVLTAFFVFINGWISYQDFRYRAVYWWLFPALLISNVWIQNLHNSFDFILIQSSINFAFIGLQLLLLFIYLSIKNKKTTNFVNKGLGIGDILFWLAITPLFSLPLFVIYYSISLILCLIIIITFFRKNLHEIKIPLAGIQSIQLVLFYFLTNHLKITVI